MDVCALKTVRGHIEVRGWGFTLTIKPESLSQENLTHSNGAEGLWGQHFQRLFFCQVLLFSPNQFPVIFWGVGRNNLPLIYQINMSGLHVILNISPCADCTQLSSRPDHTEWWGFCCFDILAGHRVLITWFSSCIMIGRLAQPLTHRKC